MCYVVKVNIYIVTPDHTDFNYGLVAVSVECQHDNQQICAKRVATIYQALLIGESSFLTPGSRRQYAPCYVPFANYLPLSIIGKTHNESRSLKHLVQQQLGSGVVSVAELFCS